MNMIRNITDCLPSAEANHKLHLTCYSDIPNYYWWWLSFTSIFSINTFIMLVSIEYKEFVLKTFIQLLLLIQSALNVVYFVSIYSGLDTTSNFVNRYIAYLFPSRLTHMICMISWLLMMTILKEILNNIESLSMKNLNTNKQRQKIIIISSIFATIISMLSILAGLYHESDSDNDLNMFNIGYIGSNLVIAFVILFIICLSTIYIIKIRKFSMIIKKDTHVKRKLNELMFLMCTILSVGVITISIVVFFQLSILMEYWTPMLSFVYINTIYLTYIIHLNISMYIVNNNWKNMWKNLFNKYLRSNKSSPKIAPLSDKKTNVVIFKL